MKVWSKNCRSASGQRKPKRVYLLRSRAEFHARGMARRFKQKFNAYTCARCGGWHVGRAGKRAGYANAPSFLDEEIGERAFTHLMRENYGGQRERLDRIKRPLLKAWLRSRV